MHIILQEQSDSYYTGAMMRHPNDPDLIFPHRYRSSNFSAVLSVYGHMIPLPSRSAFKPRKVAKS